MNEAELEEYLQRKEKEQPGFRAKYNKALDEVVSKTKKRAKKQGMTVKEYVEGILQHFE